MAITDITTRTSADTNASADINTLNTNDQVLAEEAPTGFKNLVIDGDFNHWNGGTSISADGYGATDMWGLDLSGATGSLSQQASSPSTTSKPYFLRLASTVANADTNVYTRLDGNVLSGKSLSIFIEAKYTTTAPTGLKVEILSDTTQRGISGAVTGLTTGFTWVRKDVTVTASTATYTAVRLIDEVSETFDIDINKIRVIETPDNLPADVIPEWVKQDEDALETLPLVQSYYQRITGNTPTMPTQGRGGSTEYIDQTVCTGVTMVQVPTVTLTSVNTIMNISGGAGIALSGSETIASERLNGNYVTFRLTDSGKFSTNGTYGVLLTNSSDYIEIDSRY